MRIFLTQSRNRTAWQITTVVFILLAAITLSVIYPTGQAHAQDCHECGGGSPTPPPGGGGGGGGGGEPPDPGDPPDPDDPPCEPYYDPPYISTVRTMDPSYPITLGQDPDDLGVDISGVTAYGGREHCTGGQARIMSFKVLRVELADSSIAWITNTLARKYPGAHVKGTYPYTPPYHASGLGTHTAQVSFHLAPLDPGYHVVTVEATQQDGQFTIATLCIPVYLMESSIIE